MPPPTPPYLFYQMETGAALPAECPAGYRFEYWRPDFRRPLPPGLAPITGVVWLIFHLLGCFANRDYSAGLVWKETRIVHLTMVFPGFFRFPFMAKADVQFGALWTEPDCRGQGLAGVAVSKLTRQLAGSGRIIWYITHESNTASQQVARRAGFRLVGHGDKLPRLGLRFLGRYELIQPVERL